LNGFQKKEFVLKWGDHTLYLGERTHIMGVLNVTPDSFSDGGLYLQKDEAIRQGLAMAREGADIIDIGGESTRPYSEAVPCDEEIARVIPVIEALRKDIKIPISIDTCKAQVAAEALRAGASMINDISALRFDPEMASIAAQAGVPVILMHMQGSPRDMQKNPTYENLLQEILDFLRDAVDRAVKAGIRKDLIIIDPGIGFGKTVYHNLEIIKELRQFAMLDRPVLLGTSRKAFIGYILKNAPDERATGTMATVSAGALNGAHIVRVHDVNRTLETVKIIDAIKTGYEV
jgi:dihydropteroate synthase